MKYTNVMKSDPPDKVPLNVIFDDNVTRRVVWREGLQCFEPIEWWGQSRVPLTDDDEEPIRSYRKLEALAWCVIGDDL